LVPDGGGELAALPADRLAAELAPCANKIMGRQNRDRGDYGCRAYFHHRSLLFAANDSAKRLFPEQTRSMMVGQCIRRDEGADDACAN
jgi:hypothetical protein